MKFRFVLNQLGLLLIVLGAAMFAIGGWDLLYFRQEGAPSEFLSIRALGFSALVGVLGGGVLYLGSRGPRTSLGKREALLLVALTWYVGAALAGLPYLIWARLDSVAFPDHAFASPMNCYFEAMSGLTTTGATILSSISDLPKSLHLWRAFTHWLGGLGIVVLFVAVLPSLGVGGKKLYRVEAPGPSPEGVRPHIRETARILWLIYLGLTLAEVVALRLAGMDWFDSVCHTFGTLATGGFSTRDASVGHYHSALVECVVIVFMVLAGMNFGLYHQAIVGKVKNVWRDPELRLYLALLAGGSAIVCFSIWGAPLVMTDGSKVPASLGGTLVEGVFTTVSIQTTTGFCTSDFNQWPFLAKGVLILLMFVGGCAGSTGGGIKVVRIWIAFKVMAYELEKVFRPNVIRPLKMGQTAIDTDLKMATLAYVLSVVVVFAAGSGLLMTLEPPDHECDFTTAATASLATLCTIGPGLEKVGAVENYGWFTNWGKLVMIILMSMGRLEVFTVLVLFAPRFWKGN